MTPALAHATSAFLTYLAEPAVRSLLVGGLAALALVALRVNRAPARLQVWTAVLCAALAMPFLGMMLPRMPLAIPASAIEKVSRDLPLPVWRPILERGKLAAKRMQPSVPVANTTAAKDAIPESESLRQAAPRRFAQAKTRAAKSVRYFAVAAPSRFRRIAQQQNSSADSFAPLSMPVMPFPLIPVVAAPGISPAKMAITIALGIYAFVALILLVRLFAGVWLSGKLGRAARAIEPLYFAGAGDRQNVQARDALRVLRLRSAIAGLKNAPALKESAAISVPATIGVARPAILLPSSWRTWSGEQLDAILAHEISHVARRDALTQTASLAHRAFFWFSPLAWWLDRRLTELAEQASDEAALAGGADRTRYAETLLGFFAQLENAPGRIWWQGVSMAKKFHAGRAERRVDRILAWTGSRRTRKWFALALVAFAAPVILVAASLHPVIAYGQDKVQSDGQNVIVPGGPKVPALPKAPKGGVPSPAIPAAPQGGVPAVPAMAPAPRGGVVAPAIAPTPGTPAPPATPAPGQGVESPALMPVPGAPEHPPIVPGPIAGAVGYGPATPPPNPALAPTGPRTVRPSPQTPPAPMPPASSTSAMVAVAGNGSVAAVAASGEPVLQQTPDRVRAGTGVGVGVGTGVGILDPREQQDEDIAAQLRAALDELQRADSESVAASARQMAAALAQLKQAQESAGAADHDQMLAAQHALEKAQRLAEQNDASRMGEAQRALSEAMRDLNEAQRRQAELRDARAREMSQRAQEMAQRAAELAERDQQSMTVSGHSNVTINGRYSSGWGPRYVMLIGPKDVSMSGSDEDLQHAMRLHEKLGKDMIWFERDEKSYIITDPAFVAKARALFAPEDALAKQQDELGRQQDALGHQQDALGEQMDKVSVRPPDITADLQRIQARLKELQSSGATQSELGRIQSELGALQSRVGRVQSQAGVQQSGIGRQQAELGRKQAALGRQQADLGRQQAAISKEASRQLRSMFDDAIAKGIAKPE